MQGFIGGKWKDASDEATISVIGISFVSILSDFLMLLDSDPATNEEIGTIPEMGIRETKEAISAARAAFNSWKLTTAKVRYAAYHALHIECLTLLL